MVIAGGQCSMLLMLETTERVAIGMSDQRSKLSMLEATERPASGTRRCNWMTILDSFCISQTSLETRVKEKEKAKMRHDHTIVIWLSACAAMHDSSCCRG